MDTRGAAQYLGVSTSFLEKDRVGRSRIPFVRLGKRRGVRYRQEDLDRYVRQCTFESTSAYGNQEGIGK
ncbi:helix-turn-helix domain-containing protein [Acidithiobacillus caldus]